MIHPAPNEQGFALRVWGEPRRQPVDMEGITLIKILKKPPKTSDSDAPPTA